jgi:hypothetical protein
MDVKISSTPGLAIILEVSQPSEDGSETSPVASEGLDLVADGIAEIETRKKGRPLFPQLESTGWGRSPKAPQPVCMVIKMGDPAGVGHVHRTSQDIFALEPGLLDLDRRNVPLLAGPKAHRKAI